MFGQLLQDNKPLIAEGAAGFFSAAALCFFVLLDGLQYEQLQEPSVQRQDFLPFKVNVLAYARHDAVLVQNPLLPLLPCICHTQ